MEINTDRHVVVALNRIFNYCILHREDVVYVVMFHY